jgi:hypothetical protein
MPENDHNRVQQRSALGVGLLLLVLLVLSLVCGRLLGIP